MEKQFVPSELAVKLKELGFNEYVLGWYNTSKELVYDNSGFIGYIKAPLWQQAFDWFRENHGLLGFIENGNIMNNIRFNACINSIERSEVGSNVVREANLFDFISYEKARYACLEKLIELCK